MTWPNASPWNWRYAPLPARTGLAPRYPGSESTIHSASRRSPASPYMICTSAGSPAIARSSQRRQPSASDRNPWSSRTCNVSDASRSQT